MKVLGYNGGVGGIYEQFGVGHDSSAAIVVDGEVVAACEEERFNREKHSGKFPIQAMQFCLEQAGLKSFEELDLVTYYWVFPMMFDKAGLEKRKDKLGLVDKVGAWGVATAMKAFNNMAGFGDEKTLKKFNKETGANLPLEKFKSVPHHLCHVASTFYESPFDESLVVTLDGSGERSSSMVVNAKGTELEVLDEVLSPNSLGLLYLWMTDFLGFQPNNDEYKVMGLAPYGDPAPHREFFRSIIDIDDDGNYEIEPNLIYKLLGSTTKTGVKVFPPMLKKALGPARKKGEPIEQKHMDIAASLQEALEHTVLTSLERIQKKTGQRRLCLAGGVALNCTMNGKIARSGLFDEIWIHPAAHDAGTSVGGALYGWHNLLGNDRHKSSRKMPYLGPSWGEDKVKEDLREYEDKINVERLEDRELFEKVAGMIADGQVIGWYQGRMEWGPRALGNRSILADPRRDDMKDIVNHVVKLREGFRPFAPSALKEHAGEWFDLTGLKESPFMLFIMPVKEDKRTKIPAVTHVDGSARVQTVDAKDNPRYHGLISAFYEKTGVPLVLNTSFNIKGEPIVNTPGDAVRCALGTGIDAVVVDNYIVTKTDAVKAELKKKQEADKWEAGRVVDGKIENHD